MRHGAIGRPPNTVLAHRMYLTPERFSEIAPAGNLRDYNPGIGVQSRRWKRNRRGCRELEFRPTPRTMGGVKGVAEPSAEMRFPVLAIRNDSFPFQGGAA